MVLTFSLRCSLTFLATSRLMSLNGAATNSASLFDRMIETASKTFERIRYQFIRKADIPGTSAFLIGIYCIA